MGDLLGEALREREQRFERKMSDAEALMWNVEKDPWLNPSGASLTVLDGKLAEAAPLLRRHVQGMRSRRPPRW